MARKKILIFGSTGSVGKNALRLIKEKRDVFEVIGLCGNRNVNFLASQVKEFRPKYVCLRDEALADRLRKKIKRGSKILAGDKGLDEFSRLDSDISLMAISGIDCLRPLLTNIAHSRRIALANKEAVVAAAKFIFRKAKKYKTEIIPVDSEINAIFQLFNSANFKNGDIEKVYLTASGGSLFSCRREALGGVTAAQVLNHPTWDMGKRITVDSATLVNKGFEAVEAHEYFNIEYKKIGILLHRQSLIHAMVKTKDQACFSCIYPPDMKKPLAYSLFYPERISLGSLKDKKETFDFSYSPISYRKFPLLEIILEAAKRKDNSLVILNAADEVAVDYFLSGKIKFTYIEKALKKIFKVYRPSELKNIKDVYYWDNWARIETKKILEKK